MTQEKGIPYQRHKPSAALREFLDPLDPGSYFDCGRARLHGLDDALLEEAETRGRMVGDDEFQLVATDLGLIYCRPSISFAIAARWDEAMLIRPHGEDPVVLPVTWPTHGELRFTVSKRLAGNIFRRWLQLRMQAARNDKGDGAKEGSVPQAQNSKAQDWEVVDRVAAADRPTARPEESVVKERRNISISAPGRKSGGNGESKRQTDRRPALDKFEAETDLPIGPPKNPAESNSEPNTPKIDLREIPDDVTDDVDLADPDSGKSADEDSKSKSAQPRSVRSRPVPSQSASHAWPENKQRPTKSDSKSEQEAEPKEEPESEPDEEPLVAAASVALPAPPAEVRPDRTSP